MVVGAVLAAVASCAAVVLPSCGGTQAPAPAVQPSEAGADASSPPDFCAEQRAHTYVSLVSFENFTNVRNDIDIDLAASPNPGNTAINPSYVSFDLTGSMLACPAPTAGKSCDDPDAESLIVVNGDGASGINCTTGYNAVAELAPDGHCLVDGGTSRFALHLVAHDLTDWGMNLGVELRQNCDNFTDPDAGMPGYPCYVDAKLGGYRGISLWARLGSDDPSVATTALVQIGDPATSTQLGGSAGMLVGQFPFNGYPDSAPLCGDPPCTPGVGPPPKGPVQCDPFSKAISLTTQWQFYVVPFDSMEQKGYGLAEPAPDLEHLLGVKFSLSKGQIGAANYDVWLSDISFYK